MNRQFKGHLNALLPYKSLKHICLEAGKGRGTCFLKTFLAKIFEFQCLAHEYNGK